MISSASYMYLAFDEWNENEFNILKRCLKIKVILKMFNQYIGYIVCVC